uniref:Aminopeptidase n=1 Tax=Saccoglossus kowalevskii TaxID=10224 RepID=A0ABM0MZT1_SACKO|nr:PREDICTED: thyrotropin-releasing hormone-degrading ectoenzyme-like [Saccoglossus kowalevskii]
MESPTTYEHSDAMVPDQKNAFVFTGNIRVKLVRRLGFISSSRHCLRKRVRFLLIMSFLILTLLLVIGVRSPNVNSPPDRQSAELSLSRRLPLDVKPTNYKIKLTPYLDEEDLERLFTFDGEVYILVTCRQMTDTVTLHAASLSVDIESIQVTDMNGDVNMGVVATNIVSQFDFFVINLKHSLQVGRQYIMYMKYSGNMTTDNRWLGFIASYSGTRYIASTHLEPTYARSVFPCFDEPSLKATFDITVKHRLGRSALSNMPNIKNHTQGEWNTAYFNTTVVMSTYLVAVVVSDFECKEAVSEGVQFRVWSAKDDLKDTQFALEIGMQFLSYFEDLWYIPYPLPKLDMVIIDIDGSGAMENWGLITFNSPMVLYNKVNDSLSQQVTVAMTVVHELTHMWFGNIVTLDWWDDTWLKEGFADFFQFWGVDHLKPGWHVYEEFYQDRITFQAFLADMDPDSQSIVAPAGKYRPPVEQFATTSYKKGAAMVMMMQTFLGEETFYEGVRNYLMRHLYGSVKRTDLWACLTEADIGKGDTDFRSLMEPWLLYPGYPLVTILRQGSVITVEQEQFLIQPLKKIRLNKDVSDTILCTGLIHSSERDWVAALAVLLKSNNNRLSVNSRKSLACSRLPVVLQRYMEQSTHAGDFADIIGDVRDSSPMGFQIAWNYTLENFDTLSKIDKASTYDLLWKFVNHMNSDKDLDNYKNLRRYITKDMTDDYYKQYAVINGNKDWMKMNYQDVADFLKNKIPSVT